jgi:hypothetical protein
MVFGVNWERMGAQRLMFAYDFCFFDYDCGHDCSALE